MHDVGLDNSFDKKSINKNVSSLNHIPIVFPDMHITMNRFNTHHFFER